MESFEGLKKYFVICNLRDEPWWYYAKWNEPIQKRQILPDSTSVRYLN